MNLVSLVNPRQCGGRPCIRGMRIRVIDILDLLANGLSTPEILQELTDLEEEDIRSAIQYARRRVDLSVDRRSGIGDEEAASW